MFCVNAEKGSKGVYVPSSLGGYLLHYRSKLRQGLNAYENLEHTSNVKLAEDCCMRQKILEQGSFNGNSR